MKKSIVLFIAGIIAMSAAQSIAATTVAKSTLTTTTPDGIRETTCKWKEYASGTRKMVCETTTIIVTTTQQPVQTNVEPCKNSDRKCYKW